MITNLANIAARLKVQAYYLNQKPVREEEVSHFINLLNVSYQMQLKGSIK